MRIDGAISWWVRGGDLSDTVMGASDEFWRAKFRPPQQRKGVEKRQLEAFVKSQAQHLQVQALKQ